jgi:hypothetical protein
VGKWKTVRPAQRPPRREPFSFIASCRAKIASFFPRLLSGGMKIYRRFGGGDVRWKSRKRLTPLSIKDFFNVGSFLRVYVITRGTLSWDFMLFQAFQKSLNIINSQSC